MTTRDLALEGLEQSINRLLALDPQALAQLATLHGRVVQLELSGTPLALNFVPGHDGRLQILGSIEGEPDSRLVGSPFDLLRASDKSQGAAQLFAGHVRFEGDSGIGHRFSQALAGLDIDWEDQLSRFTGDISAHEIGRAMRTLRAEAARVSDSSRQNLSEYLTEEARLLPHRYEVEAFLADVDDLRDDVERLEARLGLLETSRRGDAS